MQKKILLTLCLIFFTGCFQRENSVLPKEGDIVTWKQNDHLIVKAILGERRKHIVNTHCRRCEVEFYRPEREHFLGQFPIDYIPEKFSKINKLEANSLPNPYSNYQLEFNFMLNGSTGTATDKSIYSQDGMDHPDQVKVIVNNRDIKKTTGEIHKIFLKKNKDIFDEKMFIEYGLYCYPRKDIKNIWCFGESDNNRVSGLMVAFMSNNRVVVQSRESVYGGVEVYWVVNRKNLKYWKKIDAKIWDLLDIWNVSPLSDSSQ